MAEAVADIEVARDFYESIQSGLGARCVEALWTDIQRLTYARGIHARHGGLHRMLAARFPFGIYYPEAPGRIEILAVLDLRSEPARLDTALTGRK